MHVCMMGINLEKLAQRQNSECCNADFWPVDGLGFVLKFQGVTVNQSYIMIMFTGLLA